MKPLLLFLSGLCFFTSCRKPTPEVKPKTTEELLLGSWRVTEVYLDPDLTGMGNQVDDWELCRQDNFVTYLSGGEFVYNYGELKCDTSEPGSDTSTTWQLRDKTITYHSPNDTNIYTYLIQEISESTLKVEQDIPAHIAGYPAKTYFTYKRR